MSTSYQPITPEAFLTVIHDLDLELLHAESARLHNSIYHLRRSNIALEEFKHEAECKEAIDENNEVIRRQEERIEMIREEVERRGFRMEHGEESGLVVGELNGVNGQQRGDREENLQQGIQEPEYQAQSRPEISSSDNDSGSATERHTGPQVNTDTDHATSTASVDENETGDQGIYL